MPRKDLSVVTKYIGHISELTGLDLKMHIQSGMPGKRYQLEVIPNGEYLTVFLKYPEFEECVLSLYKLALVLKEARDSNAI